MGQVRTTQSTIAAIMARSEFSVGLDDIRNGRSFDWRVDSWEYERGRMFGLVAPLTMPLRVGRKLNPKAVALCEAAFDRGFII